MPIAGLRGRDFTSMASVPMISEPAGLAGVLNVHTVARRDFGERDVRLLMAIGRLVAGAVHHARMHRRLAARERAHERFAEQVVAAQEAERRRLARDIHDGISQRLVSLAFHLDAADSALRHPPDGEADGACRDGPARRPEGVVVQLDRARELVDTTLQEAHAAIGGLRPPVLDDLGLAGGLASLARELPGVQPVLELAGDRLPEHLEVALYRIAQECLQNVVKHARASVVRVGFAVRDGRARVEVADDGVGFAVEEVGPAAGEPGAGGPGAGEPGAWVSAGYGHASMRERAELVGGTLRVASRPGGGTTVTVTAPVPSPDDSSSNDQPSPFDS